MPSSAPFPSWSVLEGGQRQAEPLAREAQVLAVDADQLGPSQRSGKAQQQQGAVAQPREVTATGGHQLPELGRGQRRGLTAAAAVPAVDAAERGTDGGVTGGPVEATQAVLLADGGQPALE